jgi:nitrogen regulatory protein PII
MKKIEANFKPFKLDEIKEALEKENVPRISLSDRIKPKSWSGATRNSQNMQFNKKEICIGGRL